MKINIISTKKTAVNEDNSLTKYLYKNVYTKDGEKIGRVGKVLFKGSIIEGIVVSKAIFLKTMFVDIEYVDKFTSNSVILKINPITLLQGKKVFDSEGKDVGKIKKVLRKTNANHFESVIIKKGIFSKEKVIYPQDMQLLKKNVRLKIKL